MTEKTLTTENIRPALDALRGELAPWPVVAKKQDRLNTAQLNAANSGITSSLVAQIIANTAAIRALESAITGTGLRALVVATLPAVGTTGILYIVPVTTYDPDTDADVVNYSNEYIWIPVEDGQDSEGHYEQVGQTGIVINNGQLTITVNGTSVGTFTANQSRDTTAAITVPTNADYVDRTTDQTVAGVKTFSSTINGTAAKAIADEDGTSIKTGYVNVAGNQTVTGDKSFTGSNTFNNILPNATNTYSLGSSSYQWSSVYAQSYYYNGTEFSSKFVTTDTTQTISGLKYFSSNILHKTPQTIDVSTNPAEDITGLGLHFVDNARYWGEIAPQWTTDGTFRIRIAMTNYNTSGTSTGWCCPIVLDFAKDGSKVDIWSTHSNSNLGTSTNQWNKTYSKEYYYNGTAWGLDKENQWLVKQIIKQDTIDITTNPSAEKIGKSLYFYDGSRFWAQYVPVWGTDGSFRMELGLSNYTTLGGQGYWVVANRISKDFTTLDFYTSHGNANLGTSTNKWKTLNGVNPGALSLPKVDGWNAGVSIDTTDWDMTRGTWNEFSNSLCDGWVYFAFYDCSAADRIYVRYYGTDARYLTLSFTPGPTGYMYGSFPMAKGSKVNIAFTTSGTIMSKYIFPCLGNV